MSAQYWMQHNLRTKCVIALYDASMNGALYKLSIDIGRLCRLPMKKYFCITFQTYGMLSQQITREKMTKKIPRQVSTTNWRRVLYLKYQTSPL